MALPSPSEIRVRDPLSDTTRKERRSLLGASALGIVIVKSGLVPSKITALGIEFTRTDQRALLAALAAVVVYLLVDVSGSMKYAGAGIESKCVQAAKIAAVLAYLMIRQGDKASLTLF